MTLKRIAGINEIPRQGDGALLRTVGGVPIGLYRIGDQILAWRNVCPHEAAPVCRGRVAGTRLTSSVYEYKYGRDMEILQCPWHGWEFDLLSGEHLADGSSARLRRYPISVVDGVVYDAMDDIQKRSLRLRVTERVKETADIIVLGLVSADDSALPAWTPGTHLEVRLPSGRVRQYSLCGDPADRNIFYIAALREPQGRGGSMELHEVAQIGATIEVSAIRNRFPMKPAHRYLLIAGGIGITPIMPMVTTLLRRRKPFTLLYTGRDRSTMAFLRSVAHLPETQIIQSSRTGRIDLAAAIAEMPDKTAVYGCGPASLITQMQEAANAENGRVDIQVETFDGHNLNLSADNQESRPKHSFEVELARTGVTVHVDGGQSILHAARDVGCVLPSSCEEGWCGTCETTVLEGEIDHRDQVLTEAERESGNTMMICISRAISETLTLDA